ncbi:MAG: tRNA (guanosine(37)-N1)-methyltransferase TrmD [Propionibacteriaceae bacterium]
MTLRVDVVTIFPDYLAPIRLSLPGKAISSGLVELAVHDLRRWTDDRHRSVDDTPYGGGAGMVMTPEPWGRALDELVPDSRAPDPTGPRLIMLTPSGRLLDQTFAAELATEAHLVLACGRYEGFDARIAAHARARMRVDEVSIGDYVLNGGEAAALVLLEAVVRLVPGVVGNPASLAEESHAPEHRGLLEYPGYTKPPHWRGLDVPPILFSGHHARIATWRTEQARTRTAERRPDLLPPDERTGVQITVAEATDAGEVLTVQRAAFLGEARLLGTTDLPPLTETLVEVAEALVAQRVLVARRGARVVGAVRGRQRGSVWEVGRLAVAPDEQGQGTGSRLLTAIEEAAPAGVTTFRLDTGTVSAGNVGFYSRRGYGETGRRIFGPHVIELVILEKPRAAAADR